MIIATFRPGRTTTIAYGLWQWDYGQTLAINGLQLPRFAEVHFSFAENSGTARRAVGLTAGGVTEVAIPDDMLTIGQNIYAFVYQSDQQSGKTVKRIILNVEARPKPEDYEVSESKDLIGSLIEVANKMPYIIRIDTVIPTSGWSPDTDTDGAYALHTDITSADARDGLIAQVTLLPKYIQAARACGLCMAAQALGGALRVYAGRTPGTEIPCSIMLIGSGGGNAGSGGVPDGTGYTLPVATATRLGGVKIGEGVTVENDGTISVDENAVEEKVMATPEEVRAMLADVYGENDMN